MTSVTPTPEQGSAQNSSLPLLTSFILIGGFILVLVILLGGLTPPAPEATEVAAVQETEVVEVTPEVTEAPTVAAIPPEGRGVTVILPFTTQEISQGGTLFQSTCSACHNMDARGIQGLGKNLVDSTFAIGLSDADLAAFVTVGRPITDPLNTTGVAMPALGGNPMLTPDQLHTIVAYLRSLQVHAGHIPLDYVDAPRGDLAPVDQPASGDTTAATAVPVETTPAAATEAPTAQATSSTNSVAALQALVGGGATPTPTTNSVAALQALVGGGSAATEEATVEVTAEATTEATAAPTEASASASVASTEGQADYNITCGDCHGTNGEGSQQLTGPVAPLSESDIIGDADAIYAFLTAPPSFSPGAAFHPTYGSDPVLTETRLRAVVAYTMSLVGQ